MKGPTHSQEHIPDLVITKGISISTVVVRDLANIRNIHTFLATVDRLPQTFFLPANLLNLHHLSL